MIRFSFNTVESNELEHMWLAKGFVTQIYESFSFLVLTPLFQIVPFFAALKVLFYLFAGCFLFLFWLFKVSRTRDGKLRPGGAGQILPSLLLYSLKLRMVFTFLMDCKTHNTYLHTHTNGKR